MTNRFCSYKLAEKLSERLDEMGKDLTSMIEEVNGASATLSKTNRADEPVSGISILHSMASHGILMIFIDLADRPHPQLALVSTPGYRPRHVGTTGQGCRRSEGRSVDFISPGLWVRQRRDGWGQCRRRLLPLLHGPTVEAKGLDV